VTPESADRPQKPSAEDLRSKPSGEAATKPTSEEGSGAKKPTSLYGFDPLPHRGAPVSNELIAELLDGDEI